MRNVYLTVDNRSARQRIIIRSQAYAVWETVSSVPDAIILPVNHSQGGAAAAPDCQCVAFAVAPAGRTPCHRLTQGNVSGAGKLHDEELTDPLGSPCPIFNRDGKVVKPTFVMGAPAIFYQESEDTEK